MRIFINIKQEFMESQRLYQMHVWGSGKLIKWTRDMVSSRGLLSEASLVFVSWAYRDTSFLLFLQATAAVRPKPTYLMDNGWSR